LLIYFSGLITAESFPDMKLLYADKREVKRSILISYNADQLLVKLTIPRRTESMWSEECIGHQLGFMGKSIPPSHFHTKQKN